MVGDKTATTRSTRKAQVGDHFFINGERFNILKVKKLEHDVIAEEYHMEESFASADAYRQWFKDNRDRYVGTDRKWLHIFSKVDE